MGWVSSFEGTQIDSLFAPTLPLTSVRSVVQFAGLAGVPLRRQFAWVLLVWMLVGLVRHFLASSGVAGTLAPTSSTPIPDDQ